MGRPVSIKEASAGIDTDGILRKNPLRYRGYYYDEETGFYYLNARYYDPEIRRFISADDIDVVRVAPMGLIHKNLYAYCDNNPINRIDASGQLWSSIFEFTKTVDTEIGRTICGLTPVYAVQDGVKHVSVYPIGGTIEQWHHQGANSIWTEAIMASGMIQ